ncbi:MAG TPA: choice-of-anchor D domain-containing protein [Terriglobales bacterium]|nr:choice-of-anchor D domain-containing protein [Terriglobales bacterium]
MKDLKSRFAILGIALVVLPSLFVMMGCQGLVADPHRASNLPSLVLGTSSITWTNVAVGSSLTLTDTLSNPGGANITISGATVSGNAFQILSPSFPVTLSPGQSATISIAYTPSAAGTDTAMVTVSSSAANSSASISLTATAVAGGQLTVSPTSFAFGNVNVGSSQTLSGNFANPGNSSVTVTQAAISGGNFTLSGVSFPLTIAAKQSAPFSITFQPTQSGTQSGNLSITANVASTGSSRSFGRYRTIGHATSSVSMSVPLTGTGVATGQLTAAPGNLSFASIQSGKTETLTETLTNSTGSSVTISKATVAGTGFTLTSPSFPVTVAANQSVGITVTYAPQTTGPASGTLAITSNAPNSALSFALAGTATAVSTGTLSPQNASLGFGSVQMGSTPTMSEVLTNTGNASVTITSAAATGAGYSLSGMSMPVTVAAGGTATFSVKLSPQTAGTASGNVAITSNASNASLNIPLSATVVTAGSLTSNPSSVSFGSVLTGSSTPSTVTLTNSGGSSITISSATVSGTGYSLSGMSVPATIAAGNTATFTVTLAPQNAGTATGSAVITSNASNGTLTIPLTATVTAPGSVSPSPSSVSFGNVVVGNTQLVSETLKNPGGSSITVSQATITGSAYTISGLSLPLTLSAGQSFTFGINFAPTTTGTNTGSLLIVSNAAVPNLTLALSGTGTSVGTLSVNPNPLAFGSVTVNANKPLTGQLVATGGTVVVTSLMSNSAEFAVSGISLPATVIPGSNVSFTVTFTPQASGSASANVTVASNASNPSLQEPLTGSGTAPVSHSVGLSWNPSTSTVAGYNVYRGTVSGGPYTKINSSADAGTSYTDTSVTSGATYYYVTTSVDSSGNESVNSNQVSAAIPTP